ncbi:MAG: DUF5682 family protein, partial [Streptosporangiaceae bacterium]
MFGVRHHGPGSARALTRALAEFKPDIVLIEGPPEADPIIELAADEGMVPPVALLAYLPVDGEQSHRAAFWPFAEFSPEWQAIRYAQAQHVPVRFCDLPAAHTLAAPDPPAPDPPDPGQPDPGQPAPGQPDPGQPEPEPGPEGAEDA